MKRTAKLVFWSWLAGFVAGIAALYLTGPAIGSQLQATGAHLVGLDGDQGFTSAREAAEFIQANAKVAVAQEAQKFPPPARIYK